MSPEQWLQRTWPDQAALPFDRFMDLCLYHPQLGYYERDTAQIGAEGDFITSVSAGPLFGQLLAFQMASWLKETPFQPRLVEAGAHDGTLAKDILQWMANYEPKLINSLEYWIVEPSPNRQRQQQLRLENFAGLARWVRHLSQLPPLTGVIFSNELLDAFPVRRLGWDAENKRWFEWGVTRSEAGLAWTQLPMPAAEALSLLEEGGFEWSADLGQVLPQDYTLDLSPTAGAWWSQAAATLKMGRLMTIDYGLLAQEAFAPHRTEGTVRAYRGHRQFADVLNEPGQRDLTAHVNFTQLMLAGEASGLQTEGLFTQERFLMEIASRMTSSQPEALAGRSAALRTLVHPDRSPFRVLVQRRLAFQPSS